MLVKKDECSGKKKENHTHNMPTQQNHNDSIKAITFAKTFPSGRMDLGKQNKHTGDLCNERQGLRLVNLK